MLRECEPSLLCAERNFVDAGLAAAVQPLGTRCVVLDDADAAAGNAATPPGWTPWRDFLAAARGTPPAVRSDASAPVLLCFTSGSTGRPKGVLLSGAALAANADKRRAPDGLLISELVRVEDEGDTLTEDEIVSTSLEIAYTGEQWRLGTASRADRIDFEYSTDATTLSNGTWTGVDTLDFTSPFTTTTGALDGNAAANRTAISSTISSLNIPAGATFGVV